VHDLVIVLMHFRLSTHGVTADIKAAFLQVGVLPEHQKYLKFMWMLHDEVVFSQFLHVLFGLSPSPGLLQHVILYHSRMKTLKLGSPLAVKL
jgi:hypothetical protein